MFIFISFVIFMDSLLGLTPSVKIIRAVTEKNLWAGGGQLLAKVRGRVFLIG